MEDSVFPLASFGDSFESLFVAVDLREDDVRDLDMEEEDEGERENEADGDAGQDFFPEKEYFLGFAEDPPNTEELQLFLLPVHRICSVSWKEGF